MILSTVRKKFARFLTLDDTPERIALAFAVGVFISFSPLLGLHTVLGMLVALLFGMNRVAMLTGLWVNNPWTLLPFYSAAAYVGKKLIGFPSISTPILHFHEFWHGEYWVQLARNWTALKPLLLGSTVLSVIAGSLAYAAMLLWLRQAKRSISKAVSDRNG